VAAIIHTAEFDSTLGTIRVASSERGLAYIALPLTNGRGFMGWFQRYAGDAVPVSNPAANQKIIEELLEFIDGQRESFDLDLDLRATDFQRRVYDVVSKIPFGETLTYGDVAEAAGCPKAQRAVGAALGANPLPLVIPCHRVVGRQGKLQGYAGGLEVKAQLLAGETSLFGNGRLF
jgi:O-6-methylguanine DNA methyltransferase